MAAGKDYSGTPLSQKLGARPGSGVVVFFTTTGEELERRFDALKRTLDPADGLAHFLLAGALARCGDRAAAAREYRAAAQELTRAGHRDDAPELGGRSARELAALCATLEGQLSGGGA